MNDAASTGKLPASRRALQAGRQLPGGALRHDRLLAAACILAFVAQASCSMLYKANVADEPSHIASGYFYVLGGAPKLDEHPMFSKTVACLPLLLFRDRLIDPDTLPDKQHDFRVFLKLIYENGLSADAMLAVMRLAGIFWGAVLGVLIWRFGRDLYGPGPGLLAVFLFACSPNLLAHSRFVTLDFPVTVFTFGAVYFAWRCCARRLTWTSAVACGVFAGMASATKVSGMITVPLVAILVLIYAAIKSEAGIRLSTVRPWNRLARLKPRPRNLVATVLMLVIVSLVCYAVIWTTYRFRYETFPPESELYRSELPEMPRGNPVAVVARFCWNQKLFPRHFLWTVASVVKHNVRSDPTYMGGEGQARRQAAESGANPLFFPYAMAIKTPIPLLLLAGFSVLLSVMAVRAPRGSPRRDAARLDELLLFGFPLVFLLIAVSMNIRLGLRHVLPVYPFLCVMGSKVLVFEWPRPERFAALLTILCLWGAGSAAYIFPDHLAYFNEFAGGPGNGPEHLLDSNIDWGQDIKQLGMYMRKHDVEKVKLSYFGSADPDYYGVDYRYLPSCTLFEPRDPVAMDQLGFTGVYAVSATMLYGPLMKGYFPEYDAFLRILRERIEPTAKVGYSIYVYDFRGNTDR